MLPGEKYITIEELQLLCDKEIIKLKTEAGKKIENLLALTRDSIKDHIISNNISLPEPIDSNAGKISKGENYQGFPWIMLDFPKHFSRDSIFAIRTLFLWGEHFSCTFHLQGGFLNRYRNAVMKNFHVLKKQDYFVCVNTSAWEHHFDNDNYLPAGEISKPQLYSLLAEKEFLKIAGKLSLKEWEKLPSFAENCFTNFIELIRE